MLHLEDRGAGTPIVLFHGTPTTPDHLRPLAERLARSWRTLLLHLPGYGKSEPLEPYDVELSHALIEDTLAALDIEKAHFVTHSCGAYRAFALAGRRRIQSITISALGAVAHFPPATVASFLEFAALLRKAVDLSDAVTQLMLTHDGRQQPAWVADVRRWATASAPAHLASELEAFARAPDLRDVIRRLDTPILLRVGVLDAATTPERSSEIAAVARKCVMQLVPEVGHALLCEDFEATASAIEQHLRASEPGQHAVE